MKKKIVSENDIEQLKINNSLFGLLIFVYGVIALFNGIGGFFRFPFVYLFGYISIFAFIIPIILYGLILCIRKKFLHIKYRFSYTLFCLLFIVSLAFICLIEESFNNQCLYLYQSLEEYNTINLAYFNEGFVLSNIFNTNGGLVGYLLSGLINGLTKNSLTSLIIISIIMFIILIVLLLPLFIRIFNKSKINGIRSITKRNSGIKFKTQNIKVKNANEKIKKVESKVTYKTEDDILNENGNILFNLAKLKRQSSNQNQDSFVEKQVSSITVEDNKPIIIKANTSKKDFSSYFALTDSDFEDDKEDKVSTDKPNVVEEKQNLFADLYEEEKAKNDDVISNDENLLKDNDLNVDFEKEETVTIDNEEESNIVEDFITENAKLQKEFFEKQNEKEIEFVSKRTIANEITYSLPQLYILNDSIDNGANARNENIAYKKAQILSDKMSELNVDAKIENVVVGPTVTRYEVTLAAGVRVNTFVNLQEDFKLALGVNSIRIEAPIPGKSAIGLEVPNEYKAMVSLKEIITKLPDKHNKLYVPVGKDIGGNPISIGICDMPHCLISGATNSGKSVCANSIIMSILMNYRPDEVKMIMIDPKRVEMIAYTNVPHLLCPIIVDSDRAVVALEKLCNRMTERYTIFSKEGVKNIATYNEKMLESDGEKMPFILVFVDEFAELMLSKKASLVEEKIQKIVQLGRAAGIHLILATQRPDVNVITGTIKSNLPCRMTFRLSSLADSRTVIDISGAEKLLNNGDMLLLTPDYTGLRRVQGVYVSDKEIDDVVEYCKKQLDVQYDPYFMDLRTEEEKYEEYKQNNLINNQTMTKEDNDEILYQEIKEFVIKEQKASTSLFQRKFSLGTSRAGRMLDRLEEEGIVGPENGTKGRDVLIKNNEDVEN